MFRICGIELAVHVSFFLLLLYFAVSGWLEDGWLGAGWSLLLIILFFACVVLHELGHSLTAQRFGVRVPRILLMPIGGMAEFDRIPRQPSAEMLITIAGPAVNFVLAAVLLPLVWTELWSEQPVAAHGATDLLIHLGVANAVMGVFNLLPVFPMDGGRIFRALLAMRIDYLRATWWAASVGKVLALVAAALAAFYFENALLAVLFVFIYFAGDAEYRQLLRREQEAAYWADWSRRALLEQLRPAEPGTGESPSRPSIYHGPN